MSLCSYIMAKSILVFDLQNPYLSVDEKSSELPTEFRLFHYGSNRAYKMGEGDKEIPFNQKDAHRLIAAYLDAGVDLLIDYEHQSLDGMAGQKPAAGWIKKLEAREDGLYATQVEWTPRAMQMLKDKEVRYFSPAVEYNENGEMCRMLPAALTNLPALKGINALMNSIIANKDKTMSDENKTVETLNAAEALSQVKAAKEENEKLRKQIQDMEVNTILDKAVAEGKLAPAKRAELYSQVDALGLTGLKLVVSNLQPALKTVAVESVEEKTVNSTELSDFEKGLARSFGLSLDAFGAAKKVTAQRFAAAKISKSDTEYAKNPVLNKTIDENPSKELARKTEYLSAARTSMNLVADKPNKIGVDKE